MQIEVEVKGQRIKRLNSPGSVEDTLNYLTCHFIFLGEEWDNTVKTAYFENPASGKRHPKILADDGTCTVPWEALTDKGFVRFSVAGERDGYRITTGIESFYNSETVYGGQPSEPPTPSQYDQLIALAEQTKEIAESVRRDADEGKFDGDPGEPGKPGAPGKDGVSPTAKVEQTDDGAVITITDAAGTTTAELKNGKEGKPGQNATDEQVRGAVDAYMAEHPVQVDTDDLIKIAIKEEASGAVPIAVTDSAEMGVQDLEMQGWTEQEETTGAQLFDASKIPSKTQGGATVTNNGDGSFMITGEGRLTTIFLNSISISGNEARKFLRAGTLRTNMAKKVPQFYVYALDSDREILFTTVSTGESELTDEILGAIDRFYYVFYSEQGRVITPGIVWPMVYQDGDGTWEPYTGGQPSPNPDYPQEIVSAGNWNEETQKWEYEITIANAQTDPDKNQTVTLTSDRPLTKWDRLEKRNGVWGWVYKSMEITLDGSEKWTSYDAYSGFYSSNILPFYGNRRDGYSENAFVGVYGIYSDERFAIWLGVRNSILYVVHVPQYDADLPDHGLQNWKDWLSENPITILTYADDETFVPLSALEQEQMNAIYTFRPTTMLSNDAGCEMTIKYIADTKAYIDSKIAAIQAAVVNRI